MVMSPTKLGPKRPSSNRILLTRLLVREGAPKQETHQLSKVIEKQKQNWSKLVSAVRWVPDTEID
jgi:hypothetical protein